MAGLEDLFVSSPVVPSKSPNVPPPQKELKKDDILSLFGKVEFYLMFSAGDYISKW